MMVLKYQRLDQPYIRKNGKLVPASFNEALKAIADKIKSIKPEKITAFAGLLLPLKQCLCLKLSCKKSVVIIITLISLTIN